MLVLFDIGSTLLEGPSTGPGKRLATAFNLPPSAHHRVSNLLFRNSYTDPDHLAQVLASEYSLPLSEALTEVRSLWAAQIEEAYPLPGAQEMLDNVAKWGHAIAFVSNIWQPFMSAFHRHFPSAHANYRGYYSFELGMTKPDTSIFKAALSDFGIGADQVVVIGDTYSNDILPALTIGMKTIWVLHRPEKEKANITRVLNGLDPRPNLTLNSISELAAHHLEDLSGDSGNPWGSAYSAS